MNIEYSRKRILTLAFFVEGVVLITAVLLSFYFNIKLFPVTHNLFHDIVIGTVGSSLPFALFFFTLSERAKKIPLLGSLRKLVTGDIKALFSNLRLVDLVMVSLIAGFAEEILFRGIIQIRFGIVTASILFGLVHFVSPAYLIVTSVMGLYIGGVFYLSGSLLVPIQLHFIYDLGALVYLRYFVKEGD
jgi:membrane protease YdiL (CAAX protease family)